MLVITWVKQILYTYQYHIIPRNRANVDCTSLVLLIFLLNYCDWKLKYFERQKVTVWTVALTL